MFGLKDSNGLASAHSLSWRSRVSDSSSKRDSNLAVTQHRTAPFSTTRALPPVVALPIAPSRSSIGRYGRSAGSTSAPSAAWPPTSMRRHASSRKPRFSGSSGKTKIKMRKAELSHESLHARQLLAFQPFQEGAARCRDVSELAHHAGLIERRDGVA